MGLRSLVYGACASALYFASSVLGQSTTTMIKEPVTGFTFASAQFDTSTVPGGLTFGYALPANAMSVDATEYIGYIVATTTSNGGWTGFSHGGQMTSALLLQAWPYNGKMLSGFRYASGYVAPDIYTGNATITTIYSNINSTTYEWVYRCQNCWSWNYEGAAGSSSTSSGFQLFAWAQAEEYPLTPSDPTSNVNQHEYQDTFGGLPASAVASNYAQWATKTFPAGGSSPTSTSTKSTGTSKPTTTSTAKPTTTSVSTSTAASVSGTPVPTTTYDYIVVGGGAGGIPIADKLSEAGHSVLLIERGPASTGEWGGTLKPTWLQGTNLTRFDVPGLDNEIWENSAGIACTDINVMAGCILGGGTAINAGLWWHPPDQDFDYNFPTGWKSTDMATPVSRVFSRIPGTYIPSQDGIDYLPAGYNLIGKALAGAGWQNVTANSVPNSKNRTFTRGPWMYADAERNGPLATYLATASARKNFKLMLNTYVRRVHRTAGHITGVEVQASNSAGYSGVINVTATTGRVVLSSGTFGSARILFRSGFGPQDQLEIVNSSSADGGSMINSNQWVNLPIGYNLDDHVNTNIVLSHPNITFYDFYAAYTNPIVSDTNAYLNHRSGILAKSAPNINPLFFESIHGADGINRQLEWTARCEGSFDAPNNFSMTMAQYLGLGATSRGRATIDGGMNMQVSTVPYLHNQNDIDAVVTGLQHIIDIMKTVPGLTMLYPPNNQTVADYVANYQGGTTTSARTANHWIGTAKMGTDDGRGQTNGVNGTAVVDTNTKVYGTDNLFVVDASIFPGITTGNPSSAIVSVAEMASQKILALAAPSPVAKYGQCGGQSYSGSSVCAAGSTCTYGTPFYFQCL